MSKKDGKVYLIVYEVGGIHFHHQYVYKTLEGVIEHMKKLAETEWYMQNMRVMVCTNPRAADDGLYYVVEDSTGKATLVPVNDGSVLLYGQ